MFGKENEGVHSYKILYPFIVSKNEYKMLFFYNFTLIKFFTILYTNISQ